MTEEEIDKLWPLSKNYEYSAEIGLALRQALPTIWKEWQTPDVRRRWPLVQTRGFYFLKYLEERDPLLLKSLLPNLLNSAPTHMQEDWRAALVPHVQKAKLKEEEPLIPENLPPIFSPAESQNYSDRSKELWSWTKEALGEFEAQESEKADAEYMRSVHAGDYLYGLRLLAKEGGGKLTPETEALSWDALCAAAGAVRDAALWAWRERSIALVFVVPGSHHAGRSRGRGTCLINNLALAAEDLRKQPGVNRVAILDIDAHHGNGSEEIFFSRGDILTASVHQALPFFPGTGSPDARGSGAGKGANVNIPVGEDELWISGVEKAIGKIKDFAPDALLVQFGGDAHWRDTASDLIASADDFKVAGEMIGELEVPTAIELGAATNQEAWTYSLRSFVGGLVGRRES